MTILTAMMIITKMTPKVMPMIIAEFLCGSEASAVTKLVVVVVDGCQGVVVEVVVFDVVVFVVVVEDLVVDVLVDGSLLKLK